MARSFISAVLPKEFQVEIADSAGISVFEKEIVKETSNLSMSSLDKLRFESQKLLGASLIYAIESLKSMEQ
jgi:hypothetical protein